MGRVIRNPEEAETKEMASWEMYPSEWTLGSQPGRPYQYRPFPKMLYRAQQIPPGLPGAGKFATAVTDVPFFGYRNEDEWRRTQEAATHFTTSCQKVVEDERELSRAAEAGWRETPDEALAFAESRHKAAGQAAAERNWQD